MKMKLYSKFPVICLIWCSIEILCFGGIIYGWGSLLFVLKEEGFYYDACVTAGKSPVLQIKQITGATLNYTYNVIEKGNTSIIDLHSIDGCPEQEAKLGLWFALAVACMYVFLAFLGYLTSKFGTQITRHIFTFIFVTGSLCVAFATVETPWLLCPGLCFIGFAGMGIFATNLQVANLFPRFQSTIVAFYCGLFDSSSVVQQLVKIAHENGISRRYSFIFLAVLASFLITISSVFLLPKSYITRNKLLKKCANKDVNNDVQEAMVDEKPSELIVKEIDDYSMEDATLRMCLFSPTYIIHVLWMSLHVVLFVSFIGLLNLNLERMSNNNNHIVSYYLGVFAYTTLCTVIAGIIAGFLYDCQRKHYAGEPLAIRTLKPSIFPLIITSMLGACVYVMLAIGNLSVLFCAFILFTFYRSFLYSVGIAFLNNAFPIHLFGSLYGLMTFVNGLFSMFQYGLFSWSDAYSNAPLHVNLSLLAIAILTLIHPLLLFRKSSKDRYLAVTNGTMVSNIEITVSS